MNHTSYSQNEQWRAFWRIFYRQKNQNRIIEIPITSLMREKAQHFSKQVIQEKLKETHHQLDSHQEWKRWMTGTLGELALESFLQVSFQDTSIGLSKQYAVPDLSPLGLQVGVKSFRVGHFPLVNRSKIHPITKERIPLDAQVFLGLSQDLTRAYLFGLALDEDLFLNEQNPDNNRYVKDSNALTRKVAFTAFDRLHIFHSLQELKNLAPRYDNSLAS